MSSEIILINVTGRDRPGITAQICEVLADHGLRILDIGQAVIHDNLAWGLLVEVPESAANSPVFKELLLKTHEMDLHIRFTPISLEDYQHWVDEKGQPRHIITLLGEQVTPGDMARVAEQTSHFGLNIDQISRLSSRVSLEQAGEKQQTAIEISLRGKVTDLSAMHAAFLVLAGKLGLDIAVQEDNLYRRNRRLVCFDMDSTLIQNEVIDLLAEAAGVGEQVATITEKTMRGELDFEQSFRQRLGLLKGLPESVLPKVAEAISITQGAERLITTLKKYGFKVAILSGGFTYFAEFIRGRLAIDYIHANELDIRDGKLTGEVRGSIIDRRQKAVILSQIAREEGISLEQVIAVGDGANDLEMLSIAGLGIAYQAKPLVHKQARYSLRSSGLDSILYLLGMRDRDIDTARGD